MGLMLGLNILDILLFLSRVAAPIKFKVDKNKDLGALKPLNFFNFKVKPSKKAAIKKVDQVVLSQLSNLVQTYHFNPLEVQIRTLKSHLIKIGGLRSNFYKNRRILYADETTLNFTA